MPRTHERTGRRGRGRRTPEPPAVSASELGAWFAGHLPDDWFTDPPTIQFDRDEIIVTGDVEIPKTDGDTDAAAAARARIDAFRTSTREDRMEIADRAQHTFFRKVSWAATCGDETGSFTTASVPVMTRLMLDERALLDTLIDGGVARSRSDALAWCVQLVAENENEWLGNIRAAMSAVEDVRENGPKSRRATE